jgi:hypothetical protein
VTLCTYHSIHGAVAAAILTKLLEKTGHFSGLLTTKFVTVIFILQ